MNVEGFLRLSVDEITDGSFLKLSDDEPKTSFWWTFGSFLNLLL